MKRQTLAMGVLSVLVLALSVSACGGGGVSCAEGLGHFYDMNCAIASGGTVISRSDAIDGCEEDMPHVKNCGCKDEIDIALECFSKIGQSECSSCDVQLGNWVTCMNNCSG